MLSHKKELFIVLSLKSGGLLHQREASRSKIKINSIYSVETSNRTIFLLAGNEKRESVRIFRNGCSGSLR